MTQVSLTTLGLTALLTAGGVVAVGLLLAQKTPNTPNRNLEQELKAVVLARREAYARGERQKYAQFLSEDSLWTTATGETWTKQEMLLWVPPPPGLPLNYEIDQVQVRERGGSAVVQFRLTLGSSEHYRETDVLAKHCGRWELVAGHQTVIPLDHVVGNVDPQIYEDYSGVYGPADDGTTTQITREGDKLIRQRTGRPKHDLLPEWEDVFFIRGDPGLYIFMRNAKGRVSYLLYQSVGFQGRLQKAK